jgi:hypothetical protein
VGIRAVEGNNLNLVGGGGGRDVSGRNSHCDLLPILFEMPVKIYFTFRLQCCTVVLLQVNQTLLSRIFVFNIIHVPCSKMILQCLFQHSAYPSVGI